MKNVLNSIISRLNRTKEKISELKDRLIETSQTEKRNVKRKQLKNSKAPKDFGTISKGKIHVIRISKGE